MKRTAEKTLSIISLIFTAISVFGGFFLVSFAKFINSEIVRDGLEMDLHADPSFTTEDVELILWSLEYLEGFSWIIIVVLMISLIATIIGMVFIWNDKNPKLAGIMFIVAGLFALVISLNSIMLYIAAILSFTRKPPVVDRYLSEENYDDSMRPL